MTKGKLLLFFLIFMAGRVWSQEYQHIHTIENFEGNFTTDHLGNIFRYYSGDVIKYDSQGAKIGTFSSRDYGDISFVDATNPMKILVVYGKFSKALILDNGLAKNTEFDLVLAGIPEISLICNSREGGFWFFDPIGNQIKKINDHQIVIAEGTNLRQVTDSQLVPEQLIDSGSWVVLYASHYGFIIFDRYGTYFKTLKLEVTGTFQVISDEILLKDGDKMKIVNIKTGETRNFLLPDNNDVDECRIESKRIYLKDKTALKIFSY